MENQFIPYEQALQLRELAFDELCFATYNSSKRLIFENARMLKNSTYFWVKTAPLWQQAFDWFREKHNLFGYFDCPEYDISTYGYRVYIIGDSEEYSGELETYEEARLECLKDLIRLCKS